MGSQVGRQIAGTGVHQMQKCVHEIPPSRQRSRRFVIGTELQTPDIDCAQVRGVCSTD
jgi:hypothetical protein